MQELSADRYESLSPRPVCWRRSQKSLCLERKAFSSIGLLAKVETMSVRQTRPDHHRPCVVKRPKVGNAVGGSVEEDC